MLLCFLLLISVLSLLGILFLLLFSRLVNTKKKELLRAAFVFWVAGIPPVVRNSRRLVNLSYRVLGSSITEAVLRATFFGHFCGGSDLASVAPTVQKLEKLGVGSILDYAAEKDVQTETGELSKENRSQVFYFIFFVLLFIC
jgi:hypothetical protein